MRDTYRIAILGLGGVGGYLGGKLAALQSRRNDLRVYFIARGENLKTIRANGLKLITPGREELVHPTAVTDDPAELGTFDLLLCCVKTYDLESGLSHITPNVSEETVILPVMNGVDGSERIRKVLPRAEVWEGLIYIVARLASPGVVNVSGSSGNLVFGSESGDAGRLTEVEALMRSAGIPAQRSEHITKEMWDKYLFISPLATLTSYLDLSIGAILSDPRHVVTLKGLTMELHLVAQAKGVPHRSDFIETTIGKMKSLPPDSTTSMHNDFKKGSRTELDSLTGHVVALGNELGIATPLYEGMLAALREKSRPRT
jgi:2-dehydropantoate 2-reductase